MNYWLMKSEPFDMVRGHLSQADAEGCLSIDDLREQKRAPWIGVRGYAARNFMRDHMQVSDQVIFYHSNAKPTGVAGVAEVASSPYPDFTQYDKKSKYYDAKATTEKPIWIMVDVAFVKQFARVITRDELRAAPQLADMQLWKQSRLSITPLTKKEFETISRLGNKLK